MAYGTREVVNYIKTRRSKDMITKPKAKRVYHYNLDSSTQQEFDALVQLNKRKEARTAGHPVRRGLSQLTTSNVLTIKGYFDVKGNNLLTLRCTIYRFAKELNLHIETAYSKDKYALLVRLKKNWPVSGVDKTSD
jgi:hypothetical protein